MSGYTPSDISDPNHPYHALGLSLANARVRQQGLAPQQQFAPQQLAGPAPGGYSGGGGAPLQAQQSPMGGAAGALGGMDTRLIAQALQQWGSGSGGGGTKSAIDAPMAPKAGMGTYPGY